MSLRPATYSERETLVASRLDIVGSEKCTRFCGRITAVSGVKKMNQAACDAFCLTRGTSQALSAEAMCLRRAASVKVAYIGNTDADVKSLATTSGERALRTRQRSTKRDKYYSDTHTCAKVISFGSNLQTYGDLTPCSQSCFKP